MMVGYFVTMLLLFNYTAVYSSDDSDNGNTSTELTSLISQRTNKAPSLQLPALVNNEQAIFHTRFQELNTNFNEFQTQRTDWNIENDINRCKQLIECSQQLRIEELPYHKVYAMAAALCLCFDQKMLSQEQSIPKMFWGKNNNNDLTVDDARSLVRAAQQIVDRRYRCPIKFFSSADTDKAYLLSCVDRVLGNVDVYGQMYGKKLNMQPVDFMYEQVAGAIQANNVIDNENKMRKEAQRFQHFSNALTTLKDNNFNCSHEQFSSVLHDISLGLRPNNLEEAQLSHDIFWMQAKQKLNLLCCKKPSSQDVADINYKLNSIVQRTLQENRLVHEQK